MVYFSGWYLTHIHKWIHVSWWWIVWASPNHLLRKLLCIENSGMQNYVSQVHIHHCNTKICWLNLLINALSFDLITIIPARLWNTQGLAYLHRGCASLDWIQVELYQQIMIHKQNLWYRKMNLVPHVLYRCFTTTVTQCPLYVDLHVSKEILCLLV